MEVYTKEVVRQYVGKWVHCHSVYGMHQGIVHRALRDGFILVHHTYLASGAAATGADFEHGIHDGNGADPTQVQFFPAPGMFVPYGGVYGLWPRPFPFII